MFFWPVEPFHQYRRSLIIWDCTSTELVNSKIVLFFRNFGAILENEHALKQVPVLTSIVTRGKRGGLAGSFQNRKNLDYVTGVAEALLRVMEVIPQGILIFFSSYSQMDELVATWKTTKWSSNSNESFWEKMEKTKRVVVEPRAKEELAAIRLRYTQVRKVLKIVTRKMSSGIKAVVEKMPFF